MQSCTCLSCSTRDFRLISSITFRFGMVDSPIRQSSMYSFISAMLIPQFLRQFKLLIQAMSRASKPAKKNQVPNWFSCRFFIHFHLLRFYPRQMDWFCNQSASLSIKNISKSIYILRLLWHSRFLKTYLTLLFSPVFWISLLLLFSE